MLLSQKENSTFASAIQRKYVEPKALEEFCQNLKNEGKTLATLNGSFDLLHPGHLEMLYQGSLQADVFLVLLNTDASIKAYKAPNRPLNPLEVRLQNMAALEMVNFVSWFDETDPCQVLEKIRPNVHVNGGEYGEDCIEAPTIQKHGGRLHIVKLIDGYSTTNLLNKIRKACD